MRKNSLRTSILILASLALLITLLGGSWKASSAAFVIPTFEIVSVQVDNSVTIRTFNFPANDTFTVRMNVIGTRGVGGYQVTTVDSGSGGTFTATYNIPAELKGKRQIAIRLESAASGYYAYNWFWNDTSSGVPVTGPTLPPGVIPTFSITDVVVDGTVTIKTANFPANDTFDVLMNNMGTRGVGGTKVDTITTGSGGTLTMTFNIPDSMKGKRQIAIRLQSAASGYYAYNWFWNSTTSGVPVTGPVLPPGVVPSTTMLAVTKDVSVTVETNNFPASDTFEVLMGEYGTQGVGGIKVDTFDTGTGGSFRRTFAIPASLAGKERIAIRLQSPTSGYYTYSWFWNISYP
jgi:hypothetical protein